MATSTPTLLPPPASSSPAVPAAAPQAPRVIQTAQLISAMVKSHGHVSDLIFSPGRAPQIELSGQLVELKYKGLESLTPQDTMSIANDIMGKNETAWLAFA
jgi:Tfp pilus assembly pilus retraction ATPase PilT